MQKELGAYFQCCGSASALIRIRIDPHDFGLLDPHPHGSAFQMGIPDADPDPG
jgi:hypothetical protein